MLAAHAVSVRHMPPCGQNGVALLHAEASSCRICGKNAIVTPLHTADLPPCPRCTITRRGVRQCCLRGHRRVVTLAKQLPGKRPANAEGPRKKHKTHYKSSISKLTGRCRSPHTVCRGAAEGRRPVAMCPPRRPSHGPDPGPVCRLGATPPSPALLGLPLPPRSRGLARAPALRRATRPLVAVAPPSAPAGTVVLPPTPWDAPHDGSCSNAAPPCAPCMTCTLGPCAHRTGSAWGAAVAPPFSPPARRALFCGGEGGRGSP